MYRFLQIRRPRNRNRDKAQAAGVQKMSCPRSWGNTWMQLFQNMEKN